MIAISGPLEVWTSEEGNSHFLVLPDEDSAEVKLHSLEYPRGFRSVRVEVSIGDVTWRTSLFPRRSGGYFLPVKIDVCRKSGIAAGDQITARLKLL
jgi:hypothetical protein